MHPSSNEAASWQNRHLSARCQQQGVASEELQLILEAADGAAPVGGSCVSITLSRKAVAGLRAEGTAVACLDRIGKRAVVIGGDGTPITLLIPTGRNGRRYRHGRASRSWARH